MPTTSVQGMKLPDDTVAELQRRLRRVEGQIRGVQQMLDDGRDCRDVVTQITAANKAIEQIGVRLVTAGLIYCLTDPDRAAEDGYVIDEVQKLLLKLT